MVIRLSCWSTIQSPSWLKFQTGLVQKIKCTLRWQAVLDIWTNPKFHCKYVHVVVFDIITAIPIKDNVNWNQILCYTLLFSSCRKGSVIVNFTVTLEAVNSNEILNFMENAEKDGRLADLTVTSVSLSAVGSKYFIIAATSLHKRY